MKRKVFPQSLPRERDSYQSIHKASSHIIKRHFVYLYLGLIIKNIAMESSSKTLQWNLGYRIDKFDLG